MCPWDEDKDTHVWLVKLLYSQAKIDFPFTHKVDIFYSSRQQI